MIDKEKEFVRLIKDNQGLIHKVCMVYCNDREERQDLFQEIVLQFWKSFDGFRGEAKITTWLYRIALNTAISGLRKRSRRPESIGLEVEHMNIKADDVEQADILQLQEAIRRLSVVDRAIIMLVLEEISYEDIANMVGITQNNVRVRMNRIREKLRKQLKS